jgi:hypothetical protein
MVCLNLRSFRVQIQASMGDEVPTMKPAQHPAQTEKILCVRLRINNPSILVPVFGVFWSSLDLPYQYG